MGICSGPLCSYGGPASLDGDDHLQLILRANRLPVRAESLPFLRSVFIGLFLSESLLRQTPLLEAYRSFLPHLPRVQQF